MELLEPIMVVLIRLLLDKELVKHQEDCLVQVDQIKALKALQGLLDAEVIRTLDQDTTVEREEAAGMVVVEPLSTVRVQVKVEVEEVVVISTLLVLHLTILQGVYLILHII